MSLFPVGSVLHAAVVDSRRTRLLILGGVADIDLEARYLRLALRRAVLGRPGAETALTAAAERLDAVLAPALAGRADLVVVPTPALASAPWSLLASVAGRSVEVTPSVAAWVEPSMPRPAGGVVVAAGPDLEEAAQEVDAVSACWPGATSLSGGSATAAAVLTALDGARLAHLACHGSFRASNPLFSSLLFSDGPVTVYDLEQLSIAPEHVVLSACDSGRSGERLGQELLGLASAFFARGTRTLVASLVPVEDRRTRELMTSLHWYWSGGATPAQALQRAQQDQPDRSAAAAFVCLTARAGQTVSG